MLVAATVGAGVGLTLGIGTLLLPQAPSNVATTTMGQALVTGLVAPSSHQRLAMVGLFGPPARSAHDTARMPVIVRPGLPWRG